MHVLFIISAAVATAQAAINAGNCGKPAIAPKECNTGCTRADQLMLAEFYRIVGGMEARSGSWPWQLHMKVRNYSYCGASIVDANTVVTAAHCFDDLINPSKFKLHAGSHKTGGGDAGEKVYSVTKIKKHARYSKKTCDNDVAVMKIQGNFAWSARISPVCVSSQEPTNGKNVFVTGWGNVKGTGNAGVLKQTMVPIVGRSTCRSKYGGGITGNMICAGYSKGGHDACQGDSGGPLVVKRSGKWYLAGITSWGNGCASARYPGVYTNVAKYVSWIRNNM